MNHLSKLSFVLPITLKETNKSNWRYDPDRDTAKRFCILIKSFLKYFKLEDLDQFLIICPSNQIEAIQSLLSKLTNDDRFKIADEQKICPENFSTLVTELKPEGWYLQQIIKFAAAKYIHTAYYVTLDSDVICRKPFQYATLINDGKALMNIERLEDYYRIYKKAFAEREALIKSTRINIAHFLLTGQKSRRQFDFFYGETPVIFSTLCVQNLCNYLTKRWRRNWMEVLMRVKGWSEITLYFEFLNHSNTRTKYYLEKSCNEILDLERSAWHVSNLYNEPREYSPHHLLGNPSEGGLFVVIQSWLNPMDWIKSSGFSQTDLFYDALNDRLEE